VAGDGAEVHARVITEDDLVFLRSFIEANEIDAISDEIRAVVEPSGRS
jgi:hypothetical protein